MASRVLMVAVAAGLCLAACKKNNDTAASDAAAAEADAAQGRFASVAVTSVDGRWTNLVRANRPAGDPDAAKTLYDQHLVVIVDTRTGAIRTCGDISAYCVSGESFDPIQPTRRMRLPPYASKWGEQPDPSDLPIDPGASDTDASQ